MGRPAVERGHGVGLYPPGPRRSPLSAIVYFPGRDPLAFFSGLARKYGDLVHLFLAREHLYLVNHPAHVTTAYLRYLENRLREAFPLEGTPVRLLMRARPRAPGRRPGRSGKPSSRAVTARVSAGHR